MLAKWMKANAPMGAGSLWLAAKLGIPYHTARRLFLGERWPDPETMRRVARLTRYEITADT
jgi:hypothetical protein